MEDFNEIMKTKLALKKVEAGSYSGLSLAYIGDAVYDLIIRTYVMNKGNIQVNKMHQKTSSIVKAVSQAKMIEGMFEMLSEQEMSVYKRGRNSKPHTTAKNASSQEYMKATGFEALMGYLYLDGQYERLMELVVKGLEIIGEK